MSRLSKSYTKVYMSRAFSTKIDYLKSVESHCNYVVTRSRSHALSPAKWHSTNTYLSSLDMLCTEPDYFPTQQPLLSNLNKR